MLVAAPGVPGGLKGARQVSPFHASPSVVHARLLPRLLARVLDGQRARRGVLRMLSKLAGRLTAAGASVEEGSILEVPVRSRRARQSCPCNERRSQATQSA